MRILAVGRLTRQFFRSLAVGIVLCYGVTYVVNALMFDLLIYIGLSSIKAQVFFVLLVTMLTFILTRRYMFAAKSSGEDEAVRNADL